MIGSQTKALRFRKRLADAGFAAQAIEKIHSPIGLPEVKGKLPMEVAVSITAQLQSLYYQRVPQQSGRSTSWREIKTIMQVQNTTGILCE
jgi:xanthine dehydrogenase accessory factor